MKICPKCQSQVDDGADFCTACGSQFEKNTAQENVQYQVPPQQMYGMFDPYNHTNEFDAKDISDNKVISMLVYLTGWIGIIVALLASRDSAYVAFHVRQALKFTVIEILAGIVALLFFWTFVAPIVCGIFILVLFVVKVISFFQICNGQAKEPYIIRNFSFLK